MDSITEIILVVVLAVGISTAIYKFLPFRTHTSKKPLISLFPKYIAEYNKPYEEIIQNLEKLNFTRVNKNTFTRGKVYGDFSAKSIKLAVEINKEQNKVKVYASFFGILFDTGDIWKVTTEIIQ